MLHSMYTAVLPPVKWFLCPTELAFAAHRRAGKNVEANYPLDLVYYSKEDKLLLVISSVDWIEPIITTPTQLMQMTALPPLSAQQHPACSAASKEASSLIMTMPNSTSTPHDNIRSSQAACMLLCVFKYTAKLCWLFKVFVLEIQ